MHQRNLQENEGPKRKLRWISNQLKAANHCRAAIQGGNRAAARLKLN